jgi:hypothetical protein
MEYTSLCAIIKEEFHMPSIKYLIELSDKDRKKLEGIVRKGTSPARTIMRANILLSSDRKGKKPMTVQDISIAFHVSSTTVQKVRTEFAELGLEACLARKKRKTPPIPAKVTGEVEAHIIALACADPPEGYSRWTVRLLADKCVELGFIESISAMTVNRTLKKTNLSLT